jgi:alpha-amylase/alpha-mannosidase (GH57 family)
MQKELSVAFVWHFHQPNYQTQPNGIRLMPWARLHAIKDYLDMLLIIDKFPNLKLNFSIGPTLIDNIEDYSKNGHDIHSKLTVTPVEELTDDDKLYILNYFFDANYENLISKNSRYNELYLKRYGTEEVGINDFSLQEYADIMMLFNLVWFDPIWKNIYPELKEFEIKGRNYTLEDRQNLIELNRKIIRQIIPTFKKYQDLGKIEIITTPYNHPILPILINPNDIKTPALKHALPDCKIALLVDAKEQLKMAFEKIKNTFGKAPKGIWPSEHCISQKTVDVLANMGAKWVITDESVLSNSLKKEFVRDFRGCYEDPYDVCSIYCYKTKRNKEINLVFRDSVIPNLISFEYPHHDSVLCANDLFDRIKTVHDKLKNSPDTKHLLTIAMDGENSWDNYLQDGMIFLQRLYSLINDDKYIKTVLISDYVQKNKKNEKPLKKIVSGSWVNQEFQLWIAEPTKNLAWKYLVQTRNDLKDAEKSGRLTKEQIKNAKNEIYIAEGSDWFWWYGEPNNSGQDHIFDFMFREHLRNVYTILEKPVPSYLEMPLMSFMGKPLKNPKREITPLMNGMVKDNDEWLQAGCIEIPDGPILQENKILNRIYFGSDKDNFYIRFDINKYLMDSKDAFKEYFSIYVYIKVYNYQMELSSPSRTTNKKDLLLPVLLDGYNYEVKVALTSNRKYPLQVSKSVKDGLWELIWGHNVSYVHKEILELSIPYDSLGIKHGDGFEFFFLTGCSGVTEEVYPKDNPLSLIRP